MVNISNNIASIRKMQKQNGMTFLEVLVALVILVTGILGAVALQAVAKKNSFDTMQRSLASGLAQDIIERMRGNAAANLALYAAGSPYSGGGGAAPLDCNVFGNCNSVTTPTALTAHDIFEWKESLSGAGTKKGTVSVGGLVGGVGCINVTGGRVTVIISWQGRVDISDAAASDVGVECGSAALDKKRRRIVVNAFII